MAVCSAPATCTASGLLCTWRKGPSISGHLLERQLLKHKESGFRDIKHAWRRCLYDTAASRHNLWRNPCICDWATPYFRGTLRGNEGQATRSRREQAIPSLLFQSQYEGTDAVAHLLNLTSCFGKRDLLSEWLRKRRPMDAQACFFVTVHSDSLQRGCAPLPCVLSAPRRRVRTQAMPLSRVYSALFGWQAGLSVLLVSQDNRILCLWSAEWHGLTRISWGSGLSGVLQYRYALFGVLVVADTRPWIMSLKR